MKGNVGRAYTHETTFKDVEVRLQTSLNTATSKMIYGCICKAEKELMKLHQYLLELEATEEARENDSNVSEDSDGDGSSSNCDSNHE